MRSRRQEHPREEGPDDAATQPDMQRGMIAALLKGPGRFEVTEVARPPCPTGGLLLRVAACAVCGSDIRIFLGRKQIKGSQEIAGQVLPGHILGHEIAGVIEEVDAHEPPEFSSGHLVAVAPRITCGSCDMCRRDQSILCRKYDALGYRFPGGFAGYLAVPSRLVQDGSVNQVPEGVPAWHACLAEPLACTINAQEAMGIRPGDSVLVVGAGPIGCLHILLARYRGASLIAVSEPESGRREQARSLGADLAVGPVTLNMYQTLLEATRGEGFSAVIFAVSSIEAVRQVFGSQDAGLYRLLAPGARVNLFAGLDPGETSVTLDVRALHYQGINIFGSVNSSARQNAEALRLIASGAIPVECLVTSRLPLSRIDEALALAMSRTHLKVIVEP